MAFDTGFTHYDDPPPAELGEVEELRVADRFRFVTLAFQVLFGVIGIGVTVLVR